MQRVRFTWRRLTLIQQSRLDPPPPPPHPPPQLISESMVPNVEQTDSQYGYRLDHSTTVLEFCKRKKEKEKHSRKFNRFLVERLFVFKRNKLINTKNVVEKYAAMLYDRNEVHNIPILDI